ncbi:MAG: 50S ribosomal protein L11 methyltransferase [Thermoplasmata archaeon]|nr:50S ribosomal protein L11 methyltransferase [Thermoplasmata archaeon]
MRPLAPVERVRRRLAELAPKAALDFLPRRHERLGRVILLRLPEEARPFFPEIGRAYLEALALTSVLRHAGPVTGELRRPAYERIAGTETETVVLEHGVSYRFDAAEILFARGNKIERARAGSLVQPGERVVDLFAGIGYFAIPAARVDPTVQVEAVELNPVAYRYLLMNARLNGVADQVRAHLGDNREVPLPVAGADRVFLGVLPSSLPWIGQALKLLRPTGGTLHVHLVAERRAANGSAETAVREVVERAGGELLRATSRRVKPYGPGSEHRVVDANVRPPTASA